MGSEDTGGSGLMELQADALPVFAQALGAPGDHPACNDDDRLQQVFRPTGKGILDFAIAFLVLLWPDAVLRIRPTRAVVASSFYIAWLWRLHCPRVPGFVSGSFRVPPGSNQVRPRFLSGSFFRRSCLLFNIFPGSNRKKHF
jgi:hypothetical protein